MNLARIHPQARRRGRYQDAGQLLLELDMPDVARAHIKAVVSQVEERAEADASWNFTMVSREDLPAVIELVEGLPKPGIALRVFLAALAHQEWNTGRIRAPQSRLAKEARTTPAEVSRALSALASVGVVIREGPGRFRMNPRAAWHGSLASREAAVERHLTLVE